MLLQIPRVANKSDFFGGGCVRSCFWPQVVVQLNTGPGLSSLVIRDNLAYVSNTSINIRQTIDQ